MNLEKVLSVTQLVPKRAAGGELNLERLLGQRSDDGSAFLPLQRRDCRPRWGGRRRHRPRYGGRLWKLADRLRNWRPRRKSRDQLLDFTQMEEQIRLDPARFGNEVARGGEEVG